jgi:hypothetical protein
MLDSITWKPSTTKLAAGAMKVPIFDDAVIDLNAPAWKDRGCAAANWQRGTLSQWGTENE